MPVELFVNGTLMRGLKLHHNLDGATFLGAFRTAPVYRLYSIGDVHPDGTRPVVFELNGHAREVRVRDQEVAVSAAVRTKADEKKWQEVGATMPGKVLKIMVEPGDLVAKGADLLVTEAMKMETSVRSPKHAVVEEVLVHQGDAVEANDLLVLLAPVQESTSEE